MEPCYYKNHEFMLVITFLCRICEVNQLIEMLNTIVQYYSPYCFLMNS